MTLRRKTLIIIGVTTFSLILILYVVSQTVLLGSFTRLEKQFASQNVERATSTLSQEIATLDMLASSLAARDSTYAFIQSPSDEYILANFSNETLDSLEINLVLLVDQDGQTVSGQAFDLHNKRSLPLPQSLQAHLANDALLLRHTDAESSVSGIILLPEGPLLIAARPILTSAKEGPIRGTLIMGRYLDATEIDHLAEISHLSLSIYQLDDLQTPPDFQTARLFFLTADSEKAPIFVRVLDIESIAGYSLLENIYGEPCLILRVDTPREIFSQGRGSALYFISALVIVSLVFGMVTLLLLEIVILSRLTRLSDSVDRTGKSGDLSARVPVEGKDELSSLAGTINEMLAALEQSQNRLRESEERYRLLFNSGSDMVFVSELMSNGIPGKLVEFNDVACQRLDHTREQMLKLWFLDLTVSEDWNDFPSLAKKLLKDGQALYEATSITRDGTKIPVEFSAHVFDLGGQPAVLSIARDITARKQAEEALEQRNRELSTLYEAATAISSDLSLNVVLQTVAEQATRALGSSGCALSLWNREENLIETLVDYNTAWPEETESPGTMYDLTNYPATRNVLEVGKPCLIQYDDPTADEAELSLMRKWDVFTLLMLPLIVRDRVVGLVELMDDVKKQVYTPEEIRLAESLVAHAAIAIENAQLYEQAHQEIAERKQVEKALRESEQRFSDVARTTGDWIWEVDREGKYTYVSPVVERVLGYTPDQMLGASIYNSLHPEERERLGAEIEGILHDKKSFLGIVSPNTHKDGHTVILETTGLPLLDPAGNILGYRGAHRDVTTERQLEDRLAAVHILGRELVLTRDKQTVAQVAVDAARMLLQCQLCALWLMDKNEGTLICQTIRAAEQIENTAMLHWDSENGITTDVVQSGEPIYLPDVQSDTRYIDYGLNIHSKLCVPLKIENRVIGVFCADSKNPAAFGEDDIQLFSTLADQTAMAIENAELFQREREQRESLRALATRLTETEESERRRLAQELHDRVGQNLTALGINLNVLRTQMSSKTADSVRDRLDDSLALVQQTTKRIRNVMDDLQPPVLEDYGLTATLRWYSAQFATRTGIQVIVQGEEPALRPPIAVENVLFRIVQEALTNVAKHAQATQVTITVEMDDKMASLIVSDDGIGFDLAHVSESDERQRWGLLTMAERAEAMGGHFSIESHPQQGTRIIVEVAQ